MVFQDLPLNEITPENVTRWANKLASSRSWKPATRTAAVNVLSGLFSWAVKRNHATDNPCKLVPRKRGKALKNARRFVISRDQLRRLLDVLSLEPPVHNAVVIAAKTGLRFSKIAELRPTDLQQDVDDTWFLQVDDKNGDEHRVYLFGEALSVAVKAQKRGNQFLFAGPRGGQLRQKYVREHLIPACKMSKISYGHGRDGFTFHSLRRAFASHLLSAGADIREVMTAGNWKSWESVARYAYLSDERKKDSFRKLDGVL